MLINYKGTEKKNKPGFHRRNKKITTTTKSFIHIFYYYYFYYWIKIKWWKKSLWLDIDKLFLLLVNMLANAQVSF